MSEERSSYAAAYQAAQDRERAARVARVDSADRADLVSMERWAQGRQPKGPQPPSRTTHDLVEDAPRKPQTHGLQTAPAGTDGTAHGGKRYGARRPLDPAKPAGGAPQVAASTPQLVAGLATMDRERMGKYAEHLRFYGGKPGAQWQGNARTRERRLTFNYARALCIKATSYVTVGLDFAVDPEEASEEGRAQAARTDAVIRLIAEENNLAQLLWDTELDTAVLGDGAFKVVWDAARERVLITSVDVQGLYCWWRAADPSQVWRVAQRWVSTAEELGRQGYHVVSRRRDGQVTVVEVWTDEAFDLYVDGQLVEAGPNPYGVLPYVVFPNVSEPKEQWGVSDIAAVVEAQRELNRELSQLSMILELSGNPVAVLEGVTQSTDVAVAPGQVWELPKEARAYLLDLLSGGGVGLHTAYVDLIYRVLHDLGETPRTAFGGGGLELSGVALNTELDPLLKKVQRKRTIRANAYRRLWALALRLVNLFTDEDVVERVRVVWGPVLPRDRTRQVNEEVVLTTAGIHSLRRAADAMGVEDPDAEFGRWLEERALIRAVRGGGEEERPALIGEGDVSIRQSVSAQHGGGGGGGDRSGGSRRATGGSDGGGGSGGGGAVVSTPNPTGDGWVFPRGGTPYRLPAGGGSSGGGGGAPR